KTRRLRNGVERCLTREPVEVDRADGLPGFCERAVEDRVLNARLGELVVVDLVVESPRQLVGRHPQYVAVEDLLIDAAVIEAGRDVMNVAVAEKVRDRPLREQLVADRKVHGRLHVAPIQRAQGAGQVYAEVLRRLLRPDAQRAAGRVAAE